MDNLDYKQLAQAMLGELQGVKTKAAGTAPTAQPGHGSGGLFSHPALERPLFSAFVLPNRGLASVLPARPARTENPLFGLVTGVTDTTGSEPTGPCDDPPYAGLMKLCMHQFVFGRLSRMSRVFELDSFGKMKDRGDHLDLQLLNAPMITNAPTMPGVSDPGATVSNDIAKGLFELAVAWSRDFARLIYTGTPTNNTWQSGYKEFYGLDTLINTGYRDAVTSTACAAADSLVRSFGDVQVQADTNRMVNTITGIYHYLKNLAEETNLAPVEWAIVMRPELFYIITAYWPCSYLSYRCTLADGSSSVVDSGDAIAMRDAMRAGQYLMIDGERVNVVLDNAVAETNVGAGVYESQIYFVPLTVLGGTPVTYWEYFDYSTPNGLMAAAQAFAPAGSYTISDNGRFAWHMKPPSNWCVQLVAKTEPRLLLLTPFIAARLTDVRYTPYVHERDWDPDGTYFVNGGGISQAKPSYYSPTA